MKEKNGADKALTKKGGSAVRKIVALTLSFFITVMLVSEVYTMLAYIIPYVAISMFQSTGISVAEGLTFSEFSVGDTVVLCMMWVFPCLCGVGLATAVQWKIICFVVKRVWAMLASAFLPKRDAARDGGGKEN